VAATSAGIVLVGCGGDGATGDDGLDPDARGPDDDVDGALPGPDAAGAPDAAPVVAPPEDTPEVARFGLGISAGDLVADRGIAWTRYDGTAPLAAVVWRMDGETYVDQRSYGAAVLVGGFVHVALTALVAGARYRYAFFELDDAGERTGRSAIGRFRAPPAAGTLEPVLFGAVSCIDEGRPADVLSRAAERTDLDAFLFLGDNAYCDGSNSLTDYRDKYVDHFGRAEHVAVRATTGMYITWDDHEVNNDWNPETIAAAKLDAAFTCFFEHAPLARIEGADRRIWRSARWGDTVEVFVLDCRSERLPSTILSGTPQYISPAQMAWLKAGLSASPCVFKLIMNSVPITNMPLLWDAYPTDRWEAYGSQRTEILAYIDDQAIPGVVWVAGDFHLAFTSRVSPSGAGATQREVLVGPGGQSANPLVFTLNPPQFSFATGTNNYTTLGLDPATETVTVQYYDGDGTMFHSESFVP
jgi:phosphodiesterase/alkaline phosphatase D-like protein